MADLVPVVASVLKGSGAVVDLSTTAGEACIQGKLVYKKSTDGKWWLAQADGTAEESGVGVDLGVTLNSALAGQPLAVQRGGQLPLGCTLVVGTEYVLSAAAGMACPKADLVSTNKYTRAGVGFTAAILQLDLTATGIVMP